MVGSLLEVNQAGLLWMKVWKSDIFGMYKIFT